MIMELALRASTLQLWLSLFLVLSGPMQAWALTNVTVDRNSPAISYSPMDPGLWREAWPGVRISGDGRAKATFGFNGSDIYYQGWLWSQPTTFFAQVDNGMPVTLDLTDRGTGQGDANGTAVPTTAVVTVLIAGNLTEAAHQVVLSKGDGQREVIVGSFIYSTENPPTSPSSSSTPPPASSTSSKKSSSGTLNLKVLLPSVLGSVAFTLLVCLVLFLLWSRRRKRERSVSGDNWLAMPQSSLEYDPASTQQTPSNYPTGGESRRRFWFWEAGRRTRESRVSLTGARRGVIERNFGGVIPVVPADVKQEYPNWRID